ncbi:MAG: IclR family transcriptional regulator [Streptosporangiaceae bacterium]
MGTARGHAPPKSVLERVFVLLDCFTADTPELTPAELASRTGLPKSTVHRLTRLLIEQRLLQRTDTGFQLGIRLFELGELAGDRRVLLDASLPDLEQLFELTHETIHLGVLEGNEVLYFAKIVGYRSFPLPTRTGGRWPVHASALGKILLAMTPDPLRSLPRAALKPLTPYTITDPGRLLRQLRRARREGVAYEDQESVLGNACVAAPVFDPGGCAVAAVSVSGPRMRLRAEQRAPIVRRAAANITSRISSQAQGQWR